MEMKAGSAQAESCCVYVKPEKFMQHMHNIIPKLFDCWADTVAHLFLLKSSMDHAMSQKWQDSSWMEFAKWRIHWSLFMQ